MRAMTDEELKALFDAMRRHFDITFEAAKHETRLLAESVSHLDEKHDRTRESLEQKIESSAAETRAMIKFSHVELDRRVRTLEESQRTLEENVSDLQARVERLESSTH